MSVSKFSLCQSASTVTKSLSSPAGASYQSVKRLSVCPCVNDGKTAPSSAAVSWRHHMLRLKKCSLLDCEQRWHSDADIEGFIFRNISFEYAKRWARKACSVLQNYKWNKNVMTMCVIIPRTALCSYNEQPRDSCSATALTHNRDFDIATAQRPREAMQVFIWINKICSCDTGLCSRRKCVEY